MGDSSSIGYVQPTATNGQLEDVYLNRFLQGVVVGITGMPGKLIFQRWQPGGEPPNIPDFGKDWAAVGEQGSRDRDTYANVYHEDGVDKVYRNEILNILVSFYGPNARANAQILSMGFQHPQNRETMVQNGYGFVEVSDEIVTSDQLHGRWVQRIDLTFKVSRSVQYEYEILDLLGAKLEIQPSGTSPIFENVTLQLPMFAWGPEGDFVAGWGSGNWVALP